ncbi:hypothetical protein KBP30_01130 [Streptomyces sp. Go40/10]|uniref:hypothetical protein n=1 Tax=Streptomyces sp. Go40/10 TaxID=2825844 RepID=UPI001E34E2B4|nr:hypothetical protein [Streptomyces sp. Go40/10]UFQ99907.1 hypothetical protein KBP30_01130 [Streptomyces sp. Go40/10]
MAGHAPLTLDGLSSHRRPLSDPLGLDPALLAGAAECRKSGELAEASAVYVLAGEW